MILNSLVMTAALALGQAEAKLEDAVIEDQRLAPVSDVQVPAREAGALVTLEVKEGMQVKKGMELGRIDYREAEAEVKVRTYDMEVARQKAVSKIGVEYAELAAAASRQVYRAYEEANKKGSGKTISQTDMLRYKLEWDKAVAGADKEKEELKFAGLASKGKAAELESAKVSLDNRTLRAPCDGRVVKVFRQEGEWVAPGDTVFRIVTVDRLKVVTNLDATQYGHSDVDGRPVTVEVTLPRGRKVKVEGKVVSVSPVVGAGLMLPVTAEIECPMEGGEPVVRAGQEAKLTIHVNEQPPAPAPRAARVR